LPELTGAALDPLEPPPMSHPTPTFPSEATPTNDARSCRDASATVTTTDVRARAFEAAAPILSVHQSAVAGRRRSSPRGCRGTGRRPAEGTSPTGAAGTRQTGAAGANDAWSMPSSPTPLLSARHQDKNGWPPQPVPPYLATGSFASDPLTRGLHPA
jgi:hypothetical protein